MKTTVTSMKWAIKLSQSKPERESEGMRSGSAWANHEQTITMDTILLSEHTASNELHFKSLILEQTTLRPRWLYLKVQLEYRGQWTGVRGGCNVLYSSPDPDTSSLYRTITLYIHTHRYNTWEFVAPKYTGCQTNAQQNFLTYKSPHHPWNQFKYDFGAD